jgi:lipoic acid synthetase
MIEIKQKISSNQRLRLPEWLRSQKREDKTILQFKKILKTYRLHTVCQSASCPNVTECFKKPTATFMILGDVCTRNCRFCGVLQGVPVPVDTDEPRRIGEIVKALDLIHVVITSVTRDDLKDGGAGQFAETVRQIKTNSPKVTIETLIPDFRGDEESLRIVVASGVDVLNHNVETVPRFYSFIRPQAEFRRSLHVLETAKSIRPEIVTKSGLMVGLGENRDEVLAVFERLREVDCDALTIGQYLAPNRTSPPVREYIHPEVFESYREAAMRMGFQQVQSGPRVRSSYHAEEMAAKCEGAVL